MPASFRISHHGAAWLVFHETPDVSIEILLVAHGWRRSIGNMWQNPFPQAPPPGISYEIDGFDRVGIAGCVGCAPV